jgi:endonuclease/exonuclease/phosphatase family metal-dependent hydrolase
MRGKFFTVDAFIWTGIVLFSLSLSLTQKSDTHWREKGFTALYMVASKLTDPICNAHQLYRQILIVDALHPDASPCARWMKKSALLFGSSAYSFLSLFTTLPGIELRYLALSLQKRPYLYFRGEAEEKQLTESSLSLLSWNLCCPSGGYAITDGGVLPWQYRIHQLTHAILSQDADVVCLNEIFDIQTAWRLIAGLKEAYTHFYFNMGPKAVGLSSGLFVASKVKVADCLFIQFPQETFDGRAKHCGKGFFSFDIQQEERSFVRIFSTHFQHSEIPEYPTCGELNARKQEMEIILKCMQQIQDKPCILTGDLNSEERELDAFDWKRRFDEGEIEGSGFTWGGDQFCSSLVGKPISSPLNLDHTMVMKKSSCAVLRTHYVETGFDGADFNPQAISDHKGLLTQITVGSD